MRGEYGGYRPLSDPSLCFQHDRYLRKAGFQPGRPGNPQGTGFGIPSG